MRAEPKPQQKFRRQQRNMMAGGTIDLDEIAMPEILDPRQDRATAIASRTCGLARGETRTPQRSRQWPAI